MAVHGWTVGLQPEDGGVFGSSRTVKSFETYYPQHEEIDPTVLNT